MRCSRCEEYSCDKEPINSHVKTLPTNKQSSRIFLNDYKTKLPQSFTISINSYEDIRQKYSPTNSYSTQLPKSIHHDTNEISCGSNSNLFQTENPFLPFNEYISKAQSKSNECKMCMNLSNPPAEPNECQTIVDKQASL